MIAAEEGAAAAVPAMADSSTLLKPPLETESAELPIPCQQEMAIPWALVAQSERTARLEHPVVSKIGRMDSPLPLKEIYGLLEVAVAAAVDPVFVVAVVFAAGVVVETPWNTFAKYL